MNAKDKYLDAKIEQGIKMMENLTMDGQIEVIEAGIRHFGSSPAAEELLRQLKSKKNKSFSSFGSFAFCCTAGETKTE